MKKSNIEILAPAGNTEALRAAVFSGADAIYMGGSLFSARASAVNFTDEEIREAMSFARARGVKIYLTVNTLLKDSEFQEAVEFVRFLCSVPVDGILVQDMGLFSVINKIAPDMPLHASTQMSIHSPEGAKLLADMGADRVVLSREMSLKEIEAVHERTAVELEVFVHGALCMSVSGQCYFSAMLGSRSGNRGRCAQTCRLPFSFAKHSNVLSLKDMSFIDSISELSGAGVCSAKIEGRMKRPEYVAAAVSACRKAADGEAIPTALKDDLESVFSRSGFTDGYLRGKLGGDMFGIRTKEDVVSSTSDVFSRLHEIYKGEHRRIVVDMKLSAFVGQKAVLTMTEGRNTVSAESENITETALNRPLDETYASKQLEKLGSTPFIPGEISLETDGESSLPASVMNSLRRECSEKLMELRSISEAIPCGEYIPCGEKHTAGEMKLRAVFADISQIPSNADYYEKIYIPAEVDPRELEALKQKGVAVGIDLPREFFGGEDELLEKIEAFKKAGADSFLCGNIGAVALCKKAGVRAEGGFSLNIYNTEAVKAFADMGLDSAELSFELTLEEAAEVGGKIPRGIMVYGRQELMLVRNCPLAIDGCRSCAKPESIIDRRKTKFPVMCRKGHSYRSISVFNSLPLSLSDRMHEIKNMDFGILRFTVENSVEIEEITYDFLRHNKPHYDYTRGLFYRGVI